LRKGGKKREGGTEVVSNEKRLGEFSRFGRVGGRIGGEKEIIIERDCGGKDISTEKKASSGQERPRKPKKQLVRIEGFQKMLKGKQNRTGKQTTPTREQASLGGKNWEGQEARKTAEK